MSFSLGYLYTNYINKSVIIDEELDCERIVELKDIAERFKIPFDNTRINDYQVVKLDVSVDSGSMEIYDKKNNTKYFSEFSYFSNICNFNDVFNVTRNETLSPTYVNVTVINDKSKCEYTYFVDGNTPIAERLSYVDGKGNDFYDKLQITKYNGIEYKKTVPSVSNARNECCLEYIKGINCDIFGVSETVLLRKEYMNFFNNKSNKFFNEVKVYPSINKNFYERSISLYNNKINYYIKSLYDYNKDNDFCGLCLEDVREVKIFNSSLYNSLIGYHNRASYHEVSLLNNYKDVKALLLFSQNTDYNVEDSSVNENILEVFKTDKDIVIRYSVTPETIVFHKYKHDNIYTKDTVIPKQVDECFSKDELGAIAIEIASLNDDDFIKRVVYEIDEYKNMLQFKGNNYYFDDALSPILLSNIELSDIERMISRNSTHYFNIIKREFDKIINDTYISNDELNKTKVLKCNKNPNIVE